MMNYQIRGGEPITLLERLHRKSHAVSF